MALADDSKAKKNAQENYLIKGLFISKRAKGHRDPLIKLGRRYPTLHVGRKGAEEQRV
jgi:hypothetical protein